MSKEQPAASESVSRRRVQVVGRVQGVGFRAWTARRALMLGLRGRVRNLTDGSVDVEIEGDTVAVSRMIELLRRGPSSALVREVRERSPLTDPLPAGFDVAF